MIFIIFIQILNLKRYTIRKRKNIIQDIKWYENKNEEKKESEENLNNSDINKEDDKKEKEEENNNNVKISVKFNNKTNIEDVNLDGDDLNQLDVEIK